MKGKKPNKINSFVHFLGEATANQSAFGFIFLLPTLKLDFILGHSQTHQLSTVQSKMRRKIKCIHTSYQKIRALIKT